MYINLKVNEMIDLYIGIDYNVKTIEVTIECLGVLIDVMYVH